MAFEKGHLGKLSTETITFIYLPACMDEVRNPYRPGAGTTPPALIGRDELINEFGITIRRAMARRPGKSVMPIGLRGVGKTVLLNRFAEIAGQEGARVLSRSSRERRF